VFHSFSSDSRAAPKLRALNDERPLRTLTLVSILAVLFTALLLTTIVLWSAAQSDKAARNRLQQIVEYALKRSIEKIPYDQESVAIWDDAVINARNAFDPVWVDVNLGVWMQTYFKHDRVYVIDASNRAVYAMADGHRVETTGPLENQALAKLVARLRGDIASGAIGAYEKGETRIPRVVDLAVVEDRPAIASVMPLLPHSSAVTQERGTESLILSVRFLDSSFLPDMADAYLLSGVRFSRTNDIARNEQSYALVDKSGTVIGNLVWAPDRPGSTVTSGVLPVFAIGLAIVAAAIALLIRSLRRTYTDLLASEAHARHLAFHDVLTGLPNRAYFNERLEAALSGVRQGDTEVALIFMDLDRFKEVNDTFGHPAGDELIRRLASRLDAVLGPNDVLARMGGDEFAIIKVDAPSKEDVEQFCRAIIADISQPFEVLGHHAVVGVSIGVALAPEACTDRSELARKADIALYRAKKSRRHRLQFFAEGMSKTILERRTLEQELRRALETGTELEVFYQPVYAASNIKVMGCEALVRWHHTRLGAVSPLIFVPLAEECGLIVRLGEWILREACSMACLTDIDTVSVNISPMQFLEPGFTQRVLDIVAKSGLPPHRLEIEITEGTLLESSGASSRALKALRQAGIKVALDDFGTGYSSLSSLLKLEVDRIKIDRSFVQHLGESARSIVQGMVTMAHAVDVAVTAEGVESAEQQEFLMAIGCDQLQGYLFSQPVSALAIITLLEQDKKNRAPSSAAAA